MADTKFKIGNLYIDIDKELMLFLYQIVVNGKTEYWFHSSDSGTFQFWAPAVRRIKLVSEVRGDCAH